MKHVVKSICKFLVTFTISIFVTLYHLIKALIRAKWYAKTILLVFFCGMTWLCIKIRILLWILWGVAIVFEIIATVSIMREEAGTLYYEDCNRNTFWQKEKSDEAEEEYKRFFELHHSGCIQDFDEMRRIVTNYNKYCINHTTN